MALNHLTSVGRLSPFVGICGQGCAPTGRGRAFPLRPRPRLPGWLAAEPLCAGAELIRFRSFRHFKSQLFNRRTGLQHILGVVPLITATSPLARHQAPFDTAPQGVAQRFLRHEPVLSQGRCLASDCDRQGQHTLEMVDRKAAPGPRATKPPDKRCSGRHAAWFRHSWPLVPGAGGCA